MNFKKIKKMNNNASYVRNQAKKTMNFTIWERLKIHKFSMLFVRKNRLLMCS